MSIKPMDLALKTLVKSPHRFCWTTLWHFMVIIDTHSKWPEVFEMTSTTASKTIDVLRSVFATYGLPDQFQMFLKSNCVKHIQKLE